MVHLKVAALVAAMLASGLSMERAYSLRVVRTVRVVATGYSMPGPRCWRCGSGHVAQDGSRPWVGTIATCPRLGLAFGTVVRIRGWLYRVRDRMAPGYADVDIYFESVDQALAWGKQSVVMEVLE